MVEQIKGDAANKPSVLKEVTIEKPAAGVVASSQVELI